MDGMTEADVGMRPDMPIFRALWEEGLPVISYIGIYECDKFSIGLFCLPQSAVIPIHNHPGMTGFYKLLFGTARVNSFDWVNADPPNEGGIFSAAPLRTANSTRLGSDFKANSGNRDPVGAPRLAKSKADYNISAPSNTSIVYPDDGSEMHTLKAWTPCAFLSVLAPPYSVSEGWPGTYHRKYHFSSISVGGMISVPEEQRPGYVWLEETEKGEGSLVHAKEYTGPAIVTE